MPESSRDEPDLIEGCQRLIDYPFQDKALLRAALTHASGANHRLSSNERLEFLGDAILGAVVCEMLYLQFPELLEGELTRIKSHVVSRRTCAKISKELGFDTFMVLGKGIGAQSPTPPSVLADVFESLVGAIYLDGGMAAAKSFIARHMGPEIAQAAAGRGGANHKSVLQQLAQRQFGVAPTYPLLDEKGPDHSKCFKVAAQIGGRSFPPAWGASKKDAEQRAARNAICEINKEPIPYLAD